MKVGIIGLGRMGEGMSRRMMKQGIEVWGYRRNYEKAQAAYEAGYVSGVAASLESLVQVVKRAESLYGEKSGETVYTEQPGIFQIVLRSELVDDTIDELLPLLSEGDIIIDYSDSVVDKCQEIEHYCSKLGISYIFSGTYGASYAISTCSKIFECFFENLLWCGFGKPLL
mgnify:CR=1 FL=1